MAAGAFRRFRGVAYDLPESRDSEYAYRAKNVYQKRDLGLSRREGVRRLIEYKAKGPVRTIIPMFASGGEYTGRGAEFLVQIDTEIRHVAASAASGVEPTAGPVVSRTHLINVIQGGIYDGYHKVAIGGTNFDDARESRVAVSFGDAGSADHVIYLSANLLLAYIVVPGSVSTVDVTVTNPDGLADTLSNGYTF